MLDLTGESKTVTLTDSTTITIQSRDESKTGTVSDLQVGDTISFDLASDGTTVTALKMQSRDTKKRHQQLQIHQSRYEKGKVLI